MGADFFRFGGSYESHPAAGAPSGDPSIAAPVDESMVISQKSALRFDLLVDTPVAVPFGQLTEASVVVVRVTGGGVTARLTSAAGIQQLIPVDAFALLMSFGVPFTALDLIRTPATDTTVNVFLAQKQ